MACPRFIAGYETDRIFALILQESGKWPLYPLFAPPTIAYCFFHQKYGHGLLQAREQLVSELVQIPKNTRQHLVTGASYMIPFVISGDTLLTVSAMLYGRGIVLDTVAGPNLEKLFDIDVVGLTLTVSLLAAYIGYSIAERSALVPCATGVRVDSSFGAGFFGALIIETIDGIAVHYLKKTPVHKVLRSVMFIFIISIVGTLIAVGIMIWDLDEPVEVLTSSLTQWPQEIQRGSTAMLAVSMGLMLALDMGGSVSKVAYAFMLICVTQGVYIVAAIAAVGICIPPLGIGLAMLIGRKNFSAKERETDKATLVMGCAGVTGEAIPFVAADPLCVILFIMVGSACDAVTAALAGVQYYIGWGGLIVPPVVEDKLGYIAAVVAGAAVTAVCANVLKSLARKNGALIDEEEDDLDSNFEINQLRNEPQRRLLR